MRRPLITIGREPGRTTVRKIVILSAFMDSAARNHTGLTVFTPVHTAIAIGKKVANEVMMITVESPKPLHSTTIGVQASAGIGSRTAMSGTKNARNNFV